MRTGQGPLRLSVNLVRSLTSDPLLDLSVNQSKESELSVDASAVDEHGVLVHYLALTFSTLLSSQASGAHRAGRFPGLGQLDQPYEVVQPQSTRAELPPRRSRRLRIGRLLEGARPDPGVSMPVGFLRVGRRGSARSLVSCTPMRP